MAKKTPTIESEATEATEATATTTATRGKVLKQYSANELAELIGADTKVGVSLKEVKNIVLAKGRDAILAGVGL